MVISPYIYIYANCFNSLNPSNQSIETYVKPTLQQMPLDFFRVVVAMTIGVVVFRLISCLRNFLDMEKSCVDCLWSDVKNVKAYAGFLYMRNFRK